MVQLEAKVIYEELYELVPKNTSTTSENLCFSDVDKESSAKKTTGCGVEHEKNSSDRIPESDKSTNNEGI